MPDPQRSATFRRLVADATSSGARVRMFVTPLHPSLLGALRERRDYDRLHARVLELLQEIAAAFPGTALKDYTDIGAFGGTPDAFYDGAHMRPENARALIQHLFSDG
jgi:hypothetical protein